MITLQPASYSKAKTSEDIKKYLELAPFQKDNSIEAHEGKVLEFVFQPGEPVGTLSEYYREFAMSDIAIITDTGVVKVKRQPDGRFVVVEVW